MTKNNTGYVMHVYFRQAIAALCNETYLSHNKHSIITPPVKKINRAPLAGILLVAATSAPGHKWLAGWFLSPKLHLSLQLRREEPPNQVPMQFSLFHFVLP